MGQALASLFFRTNGWTVVRFYVILSHDNLCIAVLAPGRRSALYAAVAGMMDQQRTDIDETPLYNFLRIKITHKALSSV